MVEATAWVWNQGIWVQRPVLRSPNRLPHRQHCNACASGKITGLHCVRVFDKFARCEFVFVCVGVGGHCMLVCASERLPFDWCAILRLRSCASWAGRSSPIVCAHAFVFVSAHVSPPRNKLGIIGFGQPWRRGRKCGYGLELFAASEGIRTMGGGQALARTVSLGGAGGLLGGCGCLQGLH